MRSSAKAVFLDRDGVINRKAPEGQYVTTLAEFHLLPGALDALAELTRADYRIFIVTNQRGIARGHVLQKDVDEIHEYLVSEATQAGACINSIYVCPHDYSDQCDCRKPRPGMLLRAAREHSLRLEECWMVGDSISDIEAGRASGCKTIYVGVDHRLDAEAIATDLAQAVRYILQSSRTCSEGVTR
jgi:D-glycero-D-manno-heptose 1,7-bisphosphate phosphatase